MGAYDVGGSIMYEKMEGRKKRGEVVNGFEMRMAFCYFEGAD